MYFAVYTISCGYTCVEFRHYNWWRIHIQSPKCSTFPPERWVNGERTLSIRWVHSELTVNSVNANERWTMSERREPTVNSMWTLCERKINDWIGVPPRYGLSFIVFVRNQEQEANKLKVQWCFRQSWQNNPILSNILQIICILFYLTPHHLCLEITLK